MPTTARGERWPTTARGERDSPLLRTASWFQRPPTARLPSPPRDVPHHRCPTQGNEWELLAVPEDPRVILLYNGKLKVHPLPVLLFPGGHVAFVQRLPWRYAQGAQAGCPMAGVAAKYSSAEPSGSSRLQTFTDFQCQVSHSRDKSRGQARAQRSARAPLAEQPHPVSPAA